MGSKPHVIVLPYPAQGHVAPLMKLAYKLADHGIKVTFVNSEFIHWKIVAVMPEKFEEKIPISLVSISDGLESNSDRKDHVKVTKSILSSMPVNLQNLIENINRLNKDEQVSCVIADVAIRGALEVAKKMGIKRAAVVAYGVENFALQLQATKLIEAGIIDADGFPLKDKVIYQSESFSPSNPNELTWSLKDHEAEEQKFIFGQFTRNSEETVENSNWILFNSFSELEPSACDLIPDALPIGPLLANDHIGRPFAGNFWPEDSTCLSWLDQQPERSVIYVAFGSTGSCNQAQLFEIALGLEMIGQPFLWVVRSDFTKGQHTAFPDGFIEKVADYGMIVEWAPQEKVLAHPSTACFLSHCGWNSTMEGISMGIPFLCWPCRVDQFRNKSYICAKWKVGLGVIPDENGIVTRHEIKAKVEKLLCDEDIKVNSLKLKEMAGKSISEGGSSFNNFISFIEQIQQ